MDSKVFPFSDSLVMTRYKEINDANGWGIIGKFRFFRSHTMRKFFASNIGLTPDLIDAFEGRSKNEVHEAYIKRDPRELRAIYRNNMHRVMIYDRESRAWNVTPPSMTTEYDGDDAVINLQFNVHRDEVNNCLRFLNNTFYTK